MRWEVTFHLDFLGEYENLVESVQDAVLAEAKFLQQMGPGAGRPHVDTLNGSKHSNMKELRFKADNGVWRLAFAFDPARKAIFLVAGDKSGTSEKRFYKQLIAKADARFDGHLQWLKEGEK